MTWTPAEPAARQPDERAVAIVGTGNFARNLTALLASFGLEVALYVDEWRRGEFLDRPVVAAAEVAAYEKGAVTKWVVAISNAEHRAAAAVRLGEGGVASDVILVLDDDPDLQIMRLLFERFGTRAISRFYAPGVSDLRALEDEFLQVERDRVLSALDPARSTIGLGYYGRGGGFRRHISGLIPHLAGRYNVMTMSDEVMDHAGEAPHHLYLGAGAACRLETCDLVLSAHVFPCAPPAVPRVSFSHVIYDFNLTAEYHAARIAQSDVHYLFASSRPCFDGYLDLVSRHDLRNRICVIPGGYLQLDANMAALAETADEPDCILYAPTLALAEYPHRDLVSNLGEGLAVINALLAEFPDREIIFRPHPSDLRLSELSRRDPYGEALAQLLALCAREPRCHLDDNPTSYLESYRRAALLVSDSSSTAFTFAFSTGRPVLFFSPREEEMRAALGDRMQFVADRERIGEVVASSADVAAAARRLLGRRVPDPSVIELRDETVFNPGTAAEYFATHVDLILRGEKHPAWHYLNW